MKPKTATDRIRALEQELAECRQAELQWRDSQSEEQRQNEEKFSKAFQTSPYAITITRAADGKFLDVNDAFVSYTGITREEALTDSSVGLNLWVNNEDRERVLADLRVGRAVVGREYQFQTRSGRVLTGLFSAQIIMLNQEPCVLSSINDITERKRMESALADSDIRLRTILKSIPDLIWLKDVDGMRISDHDDHPFRSMVTSCFGAWLPVISV